MSTQYDLIQAIKAAVDAVANTGVVQGRTRFSSKWDNYLDQFKDTDQSIRGWVVTIDDPNGVTPSVAPASVGRFGAIERVYHVVCYGMLGFKDGGTDTDVNSTEVAFLNTVEAVMNALDAKTDLGLNADEVVDYAVGPCTLRTYQVRQFGSVLCHYAEVAYPVTVQHVVAYA